MDGAWRHTAEQIVTKLPEADARRPGRYAG